MAIMNAASSTPVMGGFSTPSAGGGAGLTGNQTLSLAQSLLGGQGQGQEDEELLKLLGSLQPAPVQDGGFNLNTNIGGMG